MKIINKTFSIKIVYEDDYIIAFNDIKPIAPIHLLVIPKNEYSDYSDFINNASSYEIQNFFIKLSYIASLVGLTKDGYRLITNKGTKSGQKIFHFHFHIIGGKFLD